MANRNWMSGGKIFSMHANPVLLDCNFVVSAGDSAGLGIKSLKGPCINAVYMHSSVATPAALNPNPAAGNIVVQLSDNYQGVYGILSADIQSPKSGSDIKIDNSAMTVGAAYIITTLGDASAAKWQAIGVPAGITPAVGVSFIASSNGGSANVSTSMVQIAAAAGSSVASIEVLGNPNVMCAPSPSSNQGYGASMILQCRDYAGAIVAPADNSVISLVFYLSNSSVTISGE